MFKFFNKLLKNLYLSLFVHRYFIWIFMPQNSSLIGLMLQSHSLRGFASTSVYCSFNVLDSPPQPLRIYHQVYHPSCSAFVALVIEFGSKPSNSDCTHRFSSRTL
jgi:hypothetical protein